MFCEKTSVGSGNEKTKNHFFLWLLTEARTFGICRRPLKECGSHKKSVRQGRNPLWKGEMQLTILTNFSRITKLGIFFYFYLIRKENAEKRVYLYEKYADRKLWKKLFQ